IERKDELILDFKNFVSEMNRKYSSSSPYGYEPRSPLQKARGLDYDQKPDEKPRLKRYPLDKDEISFDSF
ncbi:hypothetical protein, partial [Vibrio parahaemolyticus]|uniref:hypothetical protein n=1 Tax=Vibrio parahaemolyticus TaxID=670 RepID=UPI001173FD20